MGASYVRAVSTLSVRIAHSDASNTALHNRHPTPTHGRASAPNIYPYALDTLLQSEYSYINVYRPCSQNPCGLSKATGARASRSLTIAERAGPFQVQYSTLRLTLHVQYLLWGREHNQTLGRQPVRRLSLEKISHNIAQYSHG